MIQYDSQLLMGPNLGMALCCPPVAPWRKMRRSSKTGNMADNSASIQLQNAPNGLFNIEQTHPYIFLPCIQVYHNRYLKPWNHMKSTHTGRGKRDQISGGTNKVSFRGGPCVVGSRTLQLTAFGAYIDGDAEIHWAFHPHFRHILDHFSILMHFAIFWARRSGHKKLPKNVYCSCMALGLIIDRKRMEKEQTIPSKNCFCWKCWLSQYR